MQLHPLKLVFPWIHSAFSGYLEVDQVLLLWDRILGYNDLDLLAVFAAALFVYRAETLDAACGLGEESLREILGENSAIQVVPILQQFLFAQALVS